MADKSGEFSDFERQAMRDRAKELKAEAKLLKSRADGEKILLAAVNAMTGNDKELGMKIHQIVSEEAQDLLPKTWYGMPAYANKDGKVVVFFQESKKFEARYATIGFNDKANLDEGNMWAVSFALLKIGEKEEAEIRRLVRKAIS